MIASRPKYPVNILSSREAAERGLVWNPEEKAKVVEYLADKSFHWLCSTGFLAKDSHTGEPLPWYNDTMKDGCGYYWDITLPYFIKKYDAQVPREFVDHVMAEWAHGWKPTNPIDNFAIA